MKQIDILQYTRTEIDKDTYLLAKPNSKIVYYVNEGKGTVVCKMGPCADDILREAPMKFGDIIGFNIFRNAEMKCVYRGKAKCSPSDTFDVTVGMTIARDRMLYKYHCDHSNAMVRAWETLLSVGEYFRSSLEAEARVLGAIRMYGNIMDNEDVNI